MPALGKGKGNPKPKNSGRGKGTPNKSNVVTWTSMIKHHDTFQKEHKDIESHLVIERKKNDEITYRINAFLTGKAEGKATCNANLTVIKKEMPNSKRVKAFQKRIDRLLHPERRRTLHDILRNYLGNGSRLIANA